jgi:bifunctional UDP-N-acetylglucosamine pyrophosphorylase / glucosamine-1-phosphate N-acetyltransferase
MKKTAAIILAAGKGKRMNSKKTNKVTAILGNKQMVLHTVDRLKALNVDPIIVVVGFAKESVMKVLGSSVIFAEQSKRLGTAHAVKVALKKLPENVETVLILNGDDSAFYTDETIGNLIRVHLKENAALSLLTISVENPAGLGRIIRNEEKVAGIVEEKDATEEMKRIKEINPGCYVFRVSFLKKYLKKVIKNPVTGEYYLTSLIDIAIKNKQKIQAVKGGKILWRGVNTPEELKEAGKLFINVNN